MSFVDGAPRLVPCPVVDAGETGRRLLIKSGESQRASSKQRRAGDRLASTGAMGEAQVLSESVIGRQWAAGCESPFVEVNGGCVESLGRVESSRAGRSSSPSS